jgi:hypothetical protein
MDLNTLPTTEHYRTLLYKAVEKFHISFKNARMKFGSYTYQQWENLLNSKKQ